MEGLGGRSDRWLRRIDLEEEILKRHKKVNEIEEKRLLKTFYLQYAQVNE
jgi:hypothetical protein